MNRFIGFFLEEHQLRWKAYLASGCAAFVYGFVNVFALHRAEERVSLETVAVLFAVLTLLVGVYIAKGAAFFSETEKQESAVRFSWKLAVASMAALALLTSAYLVGIPGIQAAIIDLRLKSFATFLGAVQAATNSDELLRTRYQKIASVVSTSAANRIPVDPIALRKAQTAISRSLKDRSVSEQTKQLGWATAIDLQSLTYSRDVEIGVTKPVTPREIAHSGGYVINSTLNFDKGDLYILGNHSSLVLGPGGEIAIEKGTIVFDKIDFLSITTQPGILVIGDQSNAFVRDSIVRGLIQNVERITWVDVRFENSQILYREGAPLKLRRVGFKDCDLSRLNIPPAWGPISSELKKRIEEARGEPITFIYEPSPH
jgi:hypothetical protein